MDPSVQQYLAHSLAPATVSTYRSATTRYLRFCTQYNLPPLPLCASTVTRFAAYLADCNMVFGTIRAYLSGIRFFQILNGLPDPCLGAIPLLTYVLRGIHRLGPGAPRSPRLPITPGILGLLLETWSRATEDSRHDSVMLWAACCTGFFGFLRAGEFTCSSWQAFHTDMLSPRDVSVDSHDQPTVVSVLLRRSKTDPFGQGVTIHLGRTGLPICPVVALLAYLALRGQRPGPLFLFRDGSPLSRQRLIHRVKQVLQSHGIDTTAFTGHSFRIGAATTAASMGFEDSYIQILGRWRSAAYQRYIRSPVQALAASSRRLLS